MIAITPDYYNKFKCIANRCRHSCCIGWEIDIDDSTLQKYNNFTKKVPTPWSNVIKLVTLSM